MSRLRRYANGKRRFALDRYEFSRDGFLQRRESKITDNGDQKIKFKKHVKKDDAPGDAKSIKAAYPDNPGATAPAKGAAPAPAPATSPAVTPAAAPAAASAPSDAKSIRAPYSDDPARPTPHRLKKKPAATPAVSSKPKSK